MPFQKLLNHSVIREAMERNGLNASQLAEQLGVSRQSTTSWLQGKAQPRPDKVLKMSRLLKLKFDEIYVNDTQVKEPIVAYRKKGGAVTKPGHYEKARRMGRVMEHLVDKLPFDTFDAPTRIKNPSVDYDYVQRLVAHFRKERKLLLTDKIPFESLISEFNKRQAVIVPVMWGGRKNHGNGLHIYLPESQITWVYLNLESNLLDFKYWMAHELGHILLGEESKIDAEVFCESFAAALLFPMDAAEQAYGEFPTQAATPDNLERIKELALKYEVSPITITAELNRYAANRQMQGFDFGKVIYPVTTNLNKKVRKVSELIFKSSKVEPRVYVEQSKKVFGSLFFDALKDHLSEVDDGGGFVQWTMDVPLADAKSIAQVLK